MSGIQVDNEVVQCYQELKSGKGMTWFSMRISDDKSSIIVDNKGERSGSSETDHAALGAVLPENGCRYAVLDVQAHSKTAGRDVQKIFFVVWAPDTAPIKEKMMTASTKDAVKKALEGVNFEKQCTDRDEYSFESFVEICDTTAR
eukprot:TRINITY_DN292_c0_g1_i3.p1 TRINITY_DN292_c0_g1~~TRINITY_DN292_c0_g1_i3.p1  ORF type:complete len:145 (+),score=51.82 TRINITY_DN292_c0_g1_i3:287-721(+)